MDVATRLTDPLRHRGEECDDLMPYLLLQRLDPAKIKGGSSLDLLQGLDRNLSQLRPGLTGEDLDPESYQEPMLRIAEGSHPGEAVAGNHRSVLLTRGGNATAVSPQNCSGDPSGSDRWRVLQDAADGN